MCLKVALSTQNKIYNLCCRNYKEKISIYITVEDLRHRYAKDGKYFWFCMSPESRKYFTYEEAMSACLKNDNCEYVYESDCNDEGPFQICPVTSGKGPSLSGCLYERDGNVLYCHFYWFQV